MDSIQKVSALDRVKAIIQKVMVDDPIINWNPVDKSILVLCLALTDQLLWIMWCVFSYKHPVLQDWLNLSYIPLHLTIMSVNVAVTLLILIYSCFNKHKLWIKKYLPILTISQFAFAFMYGGYSIGVCSPVTVAGYVSLFSVGLVLFERKTIYWVFFPITVFLLSSIIFTNLGYMRHAPIFSDQLNGTILSYNSFWVYSMLYFYIPIFFVSLVLFEMLLTQWRSREKFFNDMSRIDPLTGIYNRRSISNDLMVVQDEKRAYGVILLDLDHFKSINDTYGHDVGDLVLKTVSKVLSENLRGGDIVGRFGGEEFILILKEKDIKYVLEVAERCRKEIESAYIGINTGQSLRVTASFGVAMSALHLSKEQVIKLSDQALYLAKKGGRNRVHYLTEFVEAD